MYSTVVERLQTVSSAIAIAIASLLGGMNSAIAQQNIPTCRPPNAGEYLLLVISPSTDNQNQLRRVLPPETNTNVCRYLNDTVTRIGGFTKLDDANRWARFVRDSAGLSAIITTKPQDTPAAQPANYKPQALGQGYAVLVDYFNNPDVAKQVQQVVGGDIGFVSYAQRPYLLAVFTTNSREAQTTLQSLSERGFFAQLVDARRVMLLRQVVKLQ
ncbi:hypothetical protein [Calothrix sp. UHCC 0171]|uniref:hypothetical protein n=1 Tax=Calothrix sp. UHCC 0171 TaxID=3110245 RepID=UPI002B1F9FEF|nr:hypothetical protein [Calothrix sp. UHCC 0171]MEA5572237.1 hypothetical protein [Calothrix sp. UHCC 0171]